MNNIKVGYFTEGGWEGKIQKDSNYWDKNMRTDAAWICTLGATHHPILKLNTLPDKFYDIGVVVIPKELDSYINYPIARELKRVCKKIGFMQEGSSWYFQSLDIRKQMWFYSIMELVDFVWCHNDIDKEYYEGLLEKPTYINPTLMLEDESDIPTPDKEDKVIIGGNFVRWYGGFNSYMMALYYDLPIWAPSMGRKNPDEDTLEGLNHLPYLEFRKWIYELAKFKYAIHLIPNTIGGTFSLNCAYLGIPCIGNIHSNTQKLCFPELSIEPHDLKKCKILVNNLKDKDFYDGIVEKSKKNYHNNFSEHIYIRHMQKVLEEIVNE